MDELELLVDFHLDAERQGPGSPPDLQLAARLAGLHASGLYIIDI